MKKSEMVRELCKVLKGWKGSQTGPATAREIIAVFEGRGIFPQKYISSGCTHTLREPCDCKGSYEPGWDKES